MNGLSYLKTFHRLEHDKNDDIILSQNNPTTKIKTDNDIMAYNGTNLDHFDLFPSIPNQLEIEFALIS